MKGRLYLGAAGIILALAMVGAAMAQGTPPVYDHPSLIPLNKR